MLLSEKSGRLHCQDSDQNTEDESLRIITGHKSRDHGLHQADDVSSYDRPDKTAYPAENNNDKRHGDDRFSHDRRYEQDWRHHDRSHAGQGRSQAEGRLTHKAGIDAHKLSAVTVL